MTEKKQAKTSKKPSTRRQKKLVEKLADPNVKSVAEAGREAGFSESSIRSTVYGLVKKPHISQAVQTRIDRALAHHKVTPEEVLGSAVRQMRSSMDDLMDEEGYFDLAKARETGAVDLIKEIDFEQRVDLETGERSIRHKVKFDSPSSARKEVANYIGLENFGDKKPFEWTDEELAKELFNRLLTKGFQEKDIIAKLEKEYPTIDVEVLRNSNNLPNEMP